MRKNNINCIVCKKEFYSRPCHIRSGRTKFCSKNCHYEAMRGKKLSPEQKQKFIEAGYKSSLGRKHTIETRRKYSECQKGKFREQARGWQGGRRKTKPGYIMIITNEFIVHKNGKIKSKYVPEHRYIMEQHLGRKLERHEIIHHRNGIKDDNRIENLEILTLKTHKGEVECPHCRNKFFIK